MAKWKENIRLTGTINNICFYEMNGAYYGRAKSSLDRKRVLTSKEFRNTMIQASLFGRASRIGSSLYKALPADLRKHWMYRAFTGESFKWVRTGMADETVKKTVWENRRAILIHYSPVRIRSLKILRSLPESE